MIVSLNTALKVSMVVIRRGACGRFRLGLGPQIGFATPLLGQPYPNAMPIYDGVLSDREIFAVLSYIKSQWPAEIQSRHDRLNQRLRGQNN